MRNLTLKLLKCILETMQTFQVKISMMTWNYDLHNPTDIFNDFFCRLEGCVDRHAPIKKTKS